MAIKYTSSRQVGSAHELRKPQAPFLVTAPQRLHNHPYLKEEQPKKKKSLLNQTSWSHIPKRLGQVVTLSFVARISARCGAALWLLPGLSQHPGSWCWCCLDTLLGLFVSSACLRTCLPRLLVHAVYLGMLQQFPSLITCLVALPHQ